MSSLYVGFGGFGCMVANWRIYVGGWLVGLRLKIRTKELKDYFLYIVRVYGNGNQETY